mgnify:FL=1
MRELAPGVTRTEDPGGRPAVALDGRGGRAVVATTGAQVLSWHAPDGDVLWTASEPEYAPGKPVRGGVPVVFPWFGEHHGAPDLPAHGFARALAWEVVGAGAGPRVVLAVTDDPDTRRMWPHAFRLELAVDLARGLELALTVTNTGDDPCTFEEALHSYFAVGDVRTASVHGLEDVPCVEHARDPEEAWDPAAPLRFRAETDRVFQGVPDELVLRAPALGRDVRLTTQDARSAIVWNPWPKKTARLSQMAPDDWQRFCCIESANVREHAVTLAPGTRHTLRLTLASAAHG